MGYLLQRKVHHLVFDDTQGDLAGLEVRLHSLSVGAMLDLSTLADVAKEDRDSAERMFTEFANALVSWNVEEEAPDADGVGRRPVPATLEGVRACDLDFVLTIVNKWMDAIAGVSRPLGSGSPGGGTSPAPSIPMEPLSPNQLS